MNTEAQPDTETKELEVPPTEEVESAPEVAEEAICLSLGRKKNGQVDISKIDVPRSSVLRFIKIGFVSTSCQSSLSFERGDPGT